jgi:hypothetical protein
MGSIVKKIKKTVKKIVKKNPFTKAVKKVAKGIKKLGSKVWKGIKKVGGKAMKAFGKLSEKLGPIGMIALSFAMPYLASGFMTGWNAVGSWLSTAATPGVAGMTFGNTMAQLGHAAWTGISNVGAFAKGTYQGITQTISKTFEGFAGVKNAAGVRTGGSVSEGFGNLWKGTKDVFSGQAGMGTQTFATETILGQSVQVGTGQFTGNLVQTGGVSAFKANQLNQLSYQSINNAMSGVTSQYSPDMKKYVKTLQKQFNIDAHSAHKYAMNNGAGYQMQYSGPGMANTTGQYGIDFSQSGDFNMVQLKPNARPTYDYTGNSANLAFKDSGMSYIGVNNNLGKIDGETYGYGSPEKPSLLNRAKDYAGAALNALTSNDEDLGFLPTYGAMDASLDPFNTMYDGSNVTTAGGGSLLNSEDLREFYRTASSRLNYQGN